MGFINPFLDEKFKLNKCEVYDSYPYTCCGVSISYDDSNRSLIFSFKSSDLILGCYAVLLQNAGNYSVDDKLRVRNSNKVVNFTEYCDEHFKDLLEIKSEGELQTYIIEYSSGENGWNSYIYNRETVLYPVDGLHPEFYFLEKELSRRFS